MGSEGDDGMSAPARLPATGRSFGNVYQALLSLRPLGSQGELYQHSCGRVGRMWQVNFDSRGEL